ncbi:MAG TPA: PH domain-containing protein [Dehalococcoidia bacterium]|nr:PH domain-containing protein [Dehalococcoidia bacterium]
MLLKGQSLTVLRPPRATGTLVAGAASLAALALAVALAAKASGWPISFPQFLAYVGVGGLALLCLVFAFWAYTCLSLRYVLDRTGLTISWGPVKHFVAIDRIQGLVHGRGEHRPQVGGLNWWGFHVGRGQAQGLGDVLFFSTHRSPEDLVYVQTDAATYGLNPYDPPRFIAETQRLQKAGRPRRAPAVQRALVAAHPIWADRVAQWLAVAAVLLNVALWGYLFAVYPHLSNEITIQFPPIGDITALHARREIFKIPGTATAILAANLLAGLGFQWRERAATYLLLSGAVFFQALFWAAAAVAVINA